MKRLMALVALALVAATAAVVVPKATAHQIGSSGYPYRSGDLCVRVVALQSHDLAITTDGGLESEQGSWGIGGFNLDCVVKFTRPPGYLALYWQLYKWGPNVGAWVVCAGAGYYFNGNPSSYMSYSRRSQNGACGPGYYGAMITGYVLNGSWLGGGNWSGYEWL